MSTPEQPKLTVHTREAESALRHGRWEALAKNLVRNVLGMSQLSSYFFWNLELRPGEGSPDVPDLFQGEVERRASLQAARALLPLVLDGGDLGHLLLAVRRLVLLRHDYNLLSSIWLPYLVKIEKLTHCQEVWLDQLSWVLFLLQKEAQENLSLYFKSKSELLIL